MLFPSRCGACRSPGPSPCRRCASLMVRVRPDQQPTVAGVDRAIAVFRYSGPTRTLLAALKFRANRAALDWLGAELDAARRGGVAGGTLTWAPTTAARARRRGFDQAALLARAAQRAAADLERRTPGDPRLAPPELRDLLRRRPGPAQTGAVGRERAQQVAFVARPPVPPHVVVVDDVLTTGSTLAAAAVALRAAGARQVDALVVAWTPPPGSAGDQRPPLLNARRHP